MANDSMADYASIILQDDFVRVVIAPDEGASIMRYDFLAQDKPIPIFSQGTQAGRQGVLSHGAFIMLPWCNRISHGGFAVGDQWCALSPNMPAQIYPIHGTAFQQAWHVQTARATHTQLFLRAQGLGLFDYAAWLTYALDDGALFIHLRVRNEASHAIPYGFGFHPWFMRTPHMQLCFQAQGVWLTYEDCLPRKHVILEEAPNFDFRTQKHLPETPLDHCFTRFQGHARLTWPEHHLALEILADSVFQNLMVYAPRGDNILCLEPMTHSVDSFNHQHQSNHSAPTTLAPQEEMVGGCVFRPVMNTNNLSNA